MTDISDVSELVRKLRFYWTLGNELDGEAADALEAMAQHIASVEEKFDDERATTMQLQAKVHQQAQRIAELEKINEGLSISKNSLLVEGARLEKDAARYRWLREPGQGQDFVCAVSWDSPEEMDAAIDKRLLAEGRK